MGVRGGWRLAREGLMTTTKNPILTLSGHALVSFKRRLRNCGTRTQSLAGGWLWQMPVVKRRCGLRFPQSWMVAPGERRCEWPRGRLERGKARRTMVVGGRMCLTMVCPSGWRR